MSAKRILSIIALVVVAGLGIWMYSLWSRPVAHVLSGAFGADGTYAHTEEGEFYRVDVAFPQRTALWSKWFPKADEKARLTMESALDRLIAEFKANTNAENPDAQLREWMQGRKFTLAVAYQEFVAQNYISYKFDIYEDTGGAHPNGYYRTFVFDKRGNEVALRDLFAPSSAYLERLASIVRPAVIAEYAERADVSTDEAEKSLFREGLEPKDENFQNFVIDGDTLAIYLPPYQAAAYAAGPFEVRIPLPELRDILLKNVP